MNSSAVSITIFELGLTDFGTLCQVYGIKRVQHLSSHDVLIK